MPAATTIRRAAEGDADSLARMLTALSDEIGYPDSAPDKAVALRRHGFGPTPLFRALIAERDAEALGAAVYFPEFSTYRASPGVYLQDIYLVPEARASGLGRRLLSAVLRDSEEWEATYLRLASHEDNEAARAFYARLGFQTDPHERPYWIEGEAMARLKETR